MVMLGSQQRPGDDFRQYHVQTLILKLHGWEIFLCRIRGLFESQAVRQSDRVSDTFKN